MTPGVGASKTESIWLSLLHAVGEISRSVMYVTIDRSHRSRVVFLAFALSSLCSAGAWVSKLWERFILAPYVDVPSDVLDTKKVQVTKKNWTRWRWVRAPRPVTWIHRLAWKIQMGSPYLHE